MCISPSSAPIYSACSVGPSRTAQKNFWALLGWSSSKMFRTSTVTSGDGSVHTERIRVRPDFPRIDIAADDQGGKVKFKKKNN